MKKAFCISAIGSNQGKTILSSALLYHYKNSVRPYKIGPDFIDPQFHTKISSTPSINLDSFMMNENQVKWIYDKYNDKDTAIVEGVMGFYDGLDKGCSAYNITTMLNIPTILIIDGSGSYITLSAIIKGLKEYKQNNTIKGVVFNKLSSQTHYDLIKKQILQDFDDIFVLGWIKKNLTSLKNTHLGLDLTTLEQIENISKEALEHIDLQLLEQISTTKIIKNIDYYPFDSIVPTQKTIAIVYDENFSFLYYDNIVFLKELFQNVIFIDSTKDQIIPNNTDIVYICGGYVETDKHYNKIKNSNNFKQSLIKHSLSKPIYAECAGLIYLGKKIDNKPMSGILDISFELKDKRSRLGYYYNDKNIKGHAFHYSKPTSVKNGCSILSKKPNHRGEFGSWQTNKVYGTYLHIFFRNNINFIKEYFGF